MSKFATKKTYSRTVKQQGLTPGKIVVLALLSLTLIFFLTVYLFLNFYKPAITMEKEIDEDFMKILQELGDAPEYDPEAEDTSAMPESSTDNQRKKGCYTFLIVGTDNLSGSTDTIMYVMLDTRNSKITIAQFPRDTYINNNYANHKINAVLNNGRAAAIRSGKKRDEALVLGIKTLGETIRKTFGLPIDRYISVDLDGFKALVDLVEGVEMYIPFHMKYTDPEQNLYINLPEGLTLLDGDKAEQFVRFRQGDKGYKGYYNADIGRLDAQKTFMTALVKKLKTIGLTKVQKLVGLAEQYITTDIKALDMISFAKEVLNVKPEDIRMITLPGEGLYIGGVSYFSLYKQETADIINNYCNPYIDNIPVEKFDIKEWSRQYVSLADLEGQTMND